MRWQHDLPRQRLHPVALGDLASLPDPATVLVNEIIRPIGSTLTAPPMTLQIVTRSFGARIDVGPLTASALAVARRNKIRHVITLQSWWPCPRPSQAVRGRFHLKSIT